MNYVLRTLGLAIVMVVAAYAPSFASAHPPGNERVAVSQANPSKSRLISLDLRATPLPEVLSLLALQSGKNIVADSSILPTMILTLRLDKVTFQNALNVICNVADLQAREVDGVLIFGAYASMNSRYPALSMDVSGSGIGDRYAAYSKSIILTNAKASEVAAQLELALPKGTYVYADERTRSVYIKGSFGVVQSATQIAASVDVPSNAGRSTNTEMYYLKGLSTEQARDKLQAAFPFGVGTPQIVANPDNHALILSGSVDAVQTAKNILKTIDKQGKQVAIQIQVIDGTPTNDNSSLGVTFGGVDSSGKSSVGSLFTKFARPSLDLNATLNLLISKGRALILESPTVTMLNEQPGTVLVGQTIPIVFYNPSTLSTQVQFVTAGVKLEITPIINEDDSVSAKIHTEYSEVLSYQNGFPVVGTRSVTSFLRIQNNETAFIGGLMNDISSDTVSKIPILGDIPVLGPIFRNRNKTHQRDEIAFLITPRVVADGVTMDPGFALPKIPVRQLVPTSSLQPAPTASPAH